MLLCYTALQNQLKCTSVQLARGYFCSLGIVLRTLCDFYSPEKVGSVTDDTW